MIAVHGWAITGLVAGALILGGVIGFCIALLRYKP